MVAAVALISTYVAAVADGPDLVSTPELARRLGLSLRTVQRYVRAGTLVPDLTTPGGPGGRGQHRWNVDRVREELRGKAPRNDDDPGTR